MNKKSTDIKLIVFLTIIFFTMFMVFYFTININNTTLVQKVESIRAINETTTNSKTNTTSSSSKNSSTNSSTNTTTKSSNTSKSTNTTSTTSSSQTSSNTNLTNLGIKPNDFSGFSPNKTTYDVTVPEDVDQVEVYATAQSSSSKVSGTGTKKLDAGQNKVEVVVTASNGTSKTYTINITREGSATNTTNTNQEVENGLSSLKVGNLELSPEFKTNVYEYTAKYTGEDSKIDVKAVATSPSYVVETTGNDNLKDGQNIITVLVSDKEENNVATYQITLNKTNGNDEALAQEQEEAQKKAEQKRMLLIYGIIAVVIVAIIIYLIIRHRRNNAWAEEYTMPYSSDDNEDEFVDELNNKNQDENYEKTMTKQEAKEQFLSGYNNNENDYYEEKKPKKHSKGKRFK